MPPRSLKVKKTAETKQQKMVKGEFQILDKVFAPLQDYPFWPAKITKLHTESKNKDLKEKCEVFYYGRRETGECSLADLRSYTSIKTELPSKVPTSKVAAKLLKLAMVEIESDQEAGSKSPITNKLKRKHAESVPTGHTYSVLDNDGDESRDSQEEESQDQTSAVEDEGTEEEEEVTTAKKAKATPPKRGKTEDPVQSNDPVEDNTHPADTMDSSPTEKEIEVSGEKTNAAESNGSPANGMETEHAAPVETLPAHLMPSNMADVQARIDAFTNLKKTIEKGGVIPVPYVTPDPNAEPGSKIYSTEPSSDVPPLVCEEIRVEFKMMALRRMVIERLTDAKMNLPRAMSHLDAFLSLNITKDMLLRNMEVIDLIRRLQKFCIAENSSCCELDQCVAQIQAAHVRNYAERMLTKFSKLFLVPRGKSFYDVYCAAYQAENERLDEH